MDTWTGSKQEGPAPPPKAQWTEAQLALIAQGEQLIKGKMPKTYERISEAARRDKRVWRLVRMGLAGAPNCFWATEGKHTVGAPFVGVAGLGWAAQTMAQFGCAYVCMLAELPAQAAGSAQGGAHGAH